MYTEDAHFSENVFKNEKVKPYVLWFVGQIIQYIP